MVRLTHTVKTSGCASKLPVGDLNAILSTIPPMEDEKLLVEMARGLQRALASESWQKGIGIPYASTWLNNRRWEDEDKPQPSTGSAPTIPSAPRSYHLEVIDGEEVVVYDG